MLDALTHDYKWLWSYSPLKLRMKKVYMKKVNDVQEEAEYHKQFIMSSQNHFFTDMKSSVMMLS